MILLLHVLPSIIGIAYSVRSVVGVDILTPKGPNNVLPQQACYKFYLPFSPNSRYTDKRICHGKQEGNDDYDGRYQTTVFNTTELYRKGDKQTWVNDLIVDDEGSLTQTMSKLLHVSSGLNEYVLTAGSSGILYAIQDIHKTTRYSWKKDINDGFNINPNLNYPINPGAPVMRQLIQLPSSASASDKLVTLLVGTTVSTIEVLGDLDMATGDSTTRGQLYFNSTFCPKRGYIHARAVDSIAISSTWIAAASIDDGCGINIYPRNAVAVVADGPQDPTHVIMNEILEGAPIYNVVALSNGDMAVASTDSSYKTCTVSYYDMSSISISQPTLLGSVTTTAGVCAVGGMYELEDGSLM